MDADQAYRELAAALRRAETRAETAERDLADLRARFDQLVVILVAKGQLAEGHHRIFERVGVHAAGRVESRVRLRMYIDKYAMSGADVDCQALMHLCHARCCSLPFDLTEQDLDEGRILWSVTQPYAIRHEADGYCSHLDRATGGCTEHAHRPATCRGYDCRNDPQIWLDFAAGIPAPDAPRGEPRRGEQAMKPAGEGEVTLRGQARDGKAGALVVTADRGAIYLGGLASWPTTAHGLEVEVIGRLVETKYIPDPVSPKGEIRQGAWGTQTVLEGWRWRLT